MDMSVRSPLEVIQLACDVKTAKAVHDKLVKALQCAPGTLIYDDGGKLTWGHIADPTVDRRFLGLDMGGVIKKNDQLLPGALEAIHVLKDKFDGIFIVSRINDISESEKTLAFLSRHKIDEVIPSGHVHFCLQRHQKAPIVEKLKITHFVDDRTEVLSHMTSVPNRFALNPTKEQLDSFPPDGMTVVSNWEELLPLLMS